MDLLGASSPPEALRPRGGGGGRSAHRPSGPAHYGGVPPAALVRGRKPKLGELRKRLIGQLAGYLNKG